MSQSDDKSRPVVMTVSSVGKGQIYGVGQFLSTDGVQRKYPYNATY